MVSIVRDRVMATVAIVAASLLVVILLFVSAVWFFQERIAFQPPGPPYPDQSGFSRMDYLATDGQRLFGYLVGETEPMRGLLIAFHGNADLAVWQMDWAENVVRHTGVVVLLAEYRGYMGLGGHPTYEGSQRDAEAAWQFAHDTLHVPADHIAYFGHSLGSAIATELATRHPPAALLLQAPFTSARDMAGVMTGGYLVNAVWGLVSRLQFDTGAKVALIEAPVSVSHGARDGLIPSQMGRTVFDAARVKGHWLLVPNASHNDVSTTGGEDYWSWLTRALDPISTPTSFSRQ